MPPRNQDIASKYLVATEVVAPKALTWRLSDFVFAMLLAYLLVDTLNGALLRAGFWSVSMPYKLLLVGLITVLCRSYRLLLVLALVVVFFITLHLLENGSLQSALVGADWLVKFCVIPIFLSYFLWAARSDPRGGRIFLFARVCFAVLAANIILGTLGVGYSAYSAEDMTLGAKGFIYAGNELGLALVLSGSIVMQELLEKDRFGWFLGFSAVFLLLAALTAIKAAIGAALLIFLAYPCITLLSRRRGDLVPRRVLLLTVLVLVTAPLVTAAAIYFVLHFVGLWDRVEHFMSQYGLLTVLFSQRDLRAEVAVNLFVHHYDIIAQLFGTGVGWIKEHGVSANIEMDPMDFLLRYGIVGALGAYALLLSVLAMSVRAAARDVRRLYSVVVQIIVIGISIFAGHVLYSAMSAPLLAAVMAAGLVGLRPAAGWPVHPPVRPTNVLVPVDG